MKLFTQCILASLITLFATSAAAAPKIVFDSESYYWGTAYQGSKITYTFKFRNDGDETLAISQVKSSCGCTVPKDWPESVAPGQDGKISATFDTGRRKGRNQTAISVSSNDTERALVRLVMHGHIEDFLEFRPVQGVHFDGVEMKAGAERTVEIYPTGGNRFDVKEIKNSSKLIVVRREDSINEKGIGGYRLKVTLKNSAPPGPVHDYIRIVGILNESKELESGVPVRGRVLGKIGVYPERLYFRRAGVAEESAEVNLKRIDGGPLVVRKIRSDRPEITGKVIEGGEGKSVRVRITADFKASGESRGMLAGTIWILTDLDDQKEVELPYIANFPQVMKLKGQPEK